MHHSDFRWTRRQALWLFAGAIGTVGINACTRSTSDSSPVSAALGITTWIGNTALYIAKEKGFFEEAGLNLDVKTFSTVAEGFPAFTAGQLQAVTPVTSEAVSLAAKGIDYRIVAVLDTSVGADGILAQGNIQSIADFRGKQVAVQEGGVGHFFLLQILAEAGLSADDIEIVNTTPDAAAAAYEAGNIDIAYSYSPFMEKANAAQPDGQIIYDSSKMPTAIADVVAFRTDFVEANPQAIEGFVSGLFKALDFLKTNEAEGLAIAAQPLNVTPEELADQLKGVQLPDLETNLAMLGNPQSDLYLLQPMTALATFLTEQGQIDTPPDLTSVLDPQFLKQLKG
ncbi:MAG: ABC transporter substrate-binding protein [Leptolyngbyaceae cyanobacterium SL_7_1]|nr:ABC transporter substrate-binding protein [Leptolyngbyaceae cyanobacterium SL_7_1]